MYVIATDFNYILGSQKRSSKVTERKSLQDEYGSFVNNFYYTEKLLEGENVLALSYKLE